MSLCPFCGAPLPEDSRFCPRCGASVPELTPPAAPEPPISAPSEQPPVSKAMIPAAPAPAPVPLIPEDAQDKALAELRMHLHQESKAWRFFAIGVLVIMMSIAGLFLGIGSCAGLMVADRSRSEIIGGVFAMGMSTFSAVLYTLMLLPVVIVGFIMGSKTIRYYNEAATDCENAMKHAGSVGVIVLAAIFSTPALIFVIINFVKTKRHRVALETALARQRAARSASFYG